MKLEDIIKFNEANVQRIIAYHTAQEAARIIIEKWGNQKAEEPERERHEDTEADGIVFCGKCGKMKYTDI